MEDLIDSITLEFVEGMTKSGNFANRQIVALIRAMDTIDGNLVPSDRNSQLIDGTAIGIQQVAISGTFNSRVNKVIRGIPTVRKETERAFIIKHGILTTNTVAQMEVLEENVTRLMQDSIGETTVLAEVMTPLINILNEMVVNQMPVQTAITLSQNKIPSLFTQYAHVRVSTILQMYVRDMTKIMADAQGLRWFLYSGPTGPTALGNDIRHFCELRVGNVYLDKEIELWPQEDAPWDGMIPETNAFSIYINLGGFNCRHDLIPVKATDVPQAAIDRARLKGMI